MNGFEPSPEGKRCGTCGTRLERAVADGLCPKCLAKAVFDQPPQIGLGEQRSHDLGVKRLGDYELLECVARGGMGVVYRARQISLQREVAVKVLLDPAYASPEQLQRFRSEAAVAAALRHPNIVAIHDIYEADGQRFFSMDFVAGKDLAELTRHSPLPPREAAELVLKIADAVHHCHERGILHRDLKPSNVLVDAFGEPHVTDFGLAKRMDGPGQPTAWAAQLTASGQVMGTPGYMSPEQATAQRDVGPSADVYSTGALLYHLLTGRAPFVGDTPTLVLRQVEEQEPLSPRLLNANVPADLETICLKCLAKEPRQRYSSARNLALDLRRFLEGQPIQAKAIGPAERLWRWSRRHPRVAALSAFCVLLLLLIVTETLLARARLLQDQRLVRRKDYLADMRLVERAIRERNFGEATSLLEPWASGTGRQTLAGKQEDLRGFEWFYFSGLCQEDDLFVVGRHEARVLRAAFDVGGDRIVSTSSDGETRLWDVQNRKLLAKTTLGARALALAFSPDGRLAAAGSDDKNILVLDGHTLRPVGPKLGHNSPVIAVQFTSDGRHLLAVARKEFVDWNLVSGDANRGWPISPSAWFYGSFSPDGSVLALPMPGPEGVRVLETTDGRALSRIGELGVACAFSADGRWLATGQLDGAIRVWEVNNWSEVASVNTQAGNVTALAWAPNGNLLASAGRDSSLRLWSFPKCKLLAAYHGHYGTINWITFSGDSRRIATASSDYTIRIWDPTRPGRARAEPTDARVFTTNAAHVAFPQVRFIPELVDTNVGIAALEHLPAECRQTNASIHISEEAFLSLTPDGTLRRFDYAGNVLGSPMALRPTPIIYPRISPHAHWAAWKTSTDELASFGVHELAAMEQPDFCQEPGTTWLMPCFSPDEHFLAMASLEGRLAVWDLRKRQRFLQIPLPHGVPTDIAFSPDCARLAVSTADSLVTLWDLVSPDKPSLTLHAGVYAVWCVAFSPDGKRLATGSDEGEVFLWDLSTGQVAATFFVPASEDVDEVHFSKDGKTLSAAAGKRMCSWHALGY